MVQAAQQVNLLGNALKGLILPGLGVTSVLGVASQTLGQVALNSGFAGNAMLKLGADFKEFSRPVHRAIDAVRDWLDLLPGWVTSVGSGILAVAGLTGAFRVFGALGIAGGVGKITAALGGAVGLAAAAKVAAAAVAGLALAWALFRHPQINDALNETSAQVRGVVNALRNAPDAVQFIQDNPFSSTSYRNAVGYLGLSRDAGVEAWRSRNENSFFSSLRAQDGYFSLSPLEQRLFGGFDAAAGQPAGPGQGSLSSPRGPEVVIYNSYITAQDPVAIFNEPAIGRSQNGGGN